MFYDMLFNCHSFFFLHLSGSDHSSSRQPRCPSAEPRPPAPPGRSQHFPSQVGHVIPPACCVSPPSWTGHHTKMWPGGIPIRWPKHLNCLFNEDANKPWFFTKLVLDVYNSLHPQGWDLTPWKGNIFLCFVLSGEMVNQKIHHQNDGLMLY